MNYFRKISLIITHPLFIISVVPSIHIYMNKKSIKNT